MKFRILSFVKRSLATRMSLVTVFFAAIILIAALGYMFNVSRQAIRKEAVDRATNQLENTVLRVTNILDQVEVAANNTAWLINRHLDSPDIMFEYSRRILENNPDLNGCSIAFEPNFFPGRGRYFSAYSYNDNGVIETTQEGNEHYEYFYLDWYQLCKLLDRPVWTEPFMDYNPENIYSQDMIASYCQPLKDREGKYIGTLSVDLSLSWLSNTISAVKPYPNSYSIMIGQGGTYFVHPDSTKLVYQTIFTESMEHPDTAMVSLGHAMQRGEAGMRQLKVNGEDCYVFYKPLSTTGWSVAIVCPESDIFGGFNKLRRSVTGTVIGGLLLLMLVCGRFIRHEIKPLTKLARQAETIASGDFSVTLPEEGRTDEIGQLSESFTHMQHSLVNYIEELKTTTAQKASIENELQVASDIQMSMVPRMFPAFPNRNDIDLYASMTPAKEVGGDLYDFFIQEEILYFCVGDVSGKGIPASLFMAVTRNLFRIVAQQSLPPAEIASHINNILAVDNDRGMFVTMFIGQLNLKTGHLDYCNCGHNAPVIDGHFLKMQYDNQPLGLWEDDPFYGESIENIKSKQFLLYTDGLNEAENLEKELLGNDRLIALMQDAQDMSARQVVDMLKAAVEEHRAGADPNDDLTLLCLTIRS
ncbi:MAG: SpoIIE family protein phosphatase [Bacteroidales bacterium]|nr:SpoIIE family protein phosphatase [Bacteroidales bacterium]